MITVARPGLVIDDLDATAVLIPTKLVAGYLDLPRPGNIGQRALDKVVQIMMREMRYLTAAGCERRHECE